MASEKEQVNKFIYTDSFKTKDLLWEAYAGFIDNYHNYKMLKSIERSDPIVLASMNKYAFYFYDEIEDFLEDFKADLEKSNLKLEEIKKIMKQTEFLEEDYIKLRKFFATFMKITGVKNIVKEKDNPNNSVEDNR